MAGSLQLVMYLRQQCDVFWLGYASVLYARQGYAVKQLPPRLTGKRERFSLIKAGVNRNTLSKVLIRIGFNFQASKMGEHIYVLDLTKGE